MLTNDQVEALKVIADHNDGKCDRCNRPINIYRYKLNSTLAIFLRRMAQAVKQSGVNDVDVSTLGLPYSMRTQVSKLRTHGLIARVKNDENAQVAGHWLVTRKGWDWLRGEPLPAKVVVFENQVLGHEGGTLTINEVLKELPDPKGETVQITEEEAQVYADLREKPRREIVLQARFRGGYEGPNLKRGTEYEVIVNKLQLGQPVKLIAPVPREYKDLAAFQKDWAIIKQGTSA